MRSFTWAFSVRFFASDYLCTLWQGLLPAIFSKGFSRTLFGKGFPLRLLTVALLQVLSSCNHSSWDFSVRFYAGDFPCLLSLWLLCRGTFAGALLQGLSSCNLSRGFFCELFRRSLS